MDFDTEMRALVAELLPIFGRECRYTDSTGRNYTATGVFETRRTQDRNGSYVVEETGVYYLQLPVSSAAPTPGDNIVVGSKLYVVTALDTATPTGSGHIVHRLEVSR